ncbi:MAG: chromosome segregation protein SMC [Clostridiaceae bacterium]|nr:chromosome segregation protein SMC [Eubacteriales bacterium]
MRLTKLEINGFKSFAKKTEIEFQNGITAIIGPNGSGKSNIADAVRWVLGEQSAKALRGTRMEDVIFNGTEQRKPQAFCEVALTFDNADGFLPTEFNEVSVTRRIYRSGESEYLLNRTVCRLKDISTLFRDTGIGKEGYSIIGQGKVEEILSSKSGARRAAFEEAAGISKYRVRKTEAENKLEETKKNLVRLTDILEELSRQLGPLESESLAAREFLRLRDELKEIEINLFLYQYDKLNERIEALKASLAQFDEELNSQDGLYGALSAECADKEEKERAVSGAISQLQNELLKLSSGVESRSGDAKVLSERIENALRERERLDAAVRENGGKLGLYAASLAALEKGMEETRARLTENEAELKAAELEYAAQNAEIKEKEALLDSQKNSIIESMNRLADAKSLLSRFEAIQGSIAERVAAVDEEEALLLGKDKKLDAEAKEARADYAAQKEKRDALDIAHKKAISACNELNERLRSIREEMRRMEQNLEAEKSRVKVLSEMKRAHEGYYASVKNVLRDSERDMDLKKRIEGVVAELLRVPEQYETAIEMALGSALQNIVTPTEQDAKYVIEYLRKKEYGRATLLPVSAMRGRLLNEQEKAACRVDGYLGVASDLVGYDERYRGVFENLLGRTVLVRDIDAGIAINRVARGAFRIATLRGDIINPGGSMTGGSTQKREFSLVGREREIEELTGRIASFDLRVAEKNASMERAASELEQKNTEMQELLSKLHEQDVELAAQKEKLDIVLKYVQQNLDAIDRARLERSQLLDNLADVKNQCREAEAAQENLEQGNVSTREDVKRTQEALNAARAQAAISSERLTQMKVARMSLEKEFSSAQSEHKRLSQEADGVKLTVAKDKQASEVLFAQVKELNAQRAGLDTRIDAERKDLDLLTEQLHVQEEEREKHQNALDDARARRERLSEDLNDLRERRHKAEMNRSKAEMELIALQDRIWEDYELTYENALPMRRQVAVTQSHIRVDELKKEIRGLGDVNVKSIEEFKAVKERHELLNAQCEDLLKAEADLQVLISDLVETMAAEFKKQFARIQENFGIVFAELFGGGKAELVLADESDVLNCDIEIIAQPPGKKLQLLTLLSGGERALTAIALLFAILKLKPTAFCILDEIESSLDEANVSNFAEYVRNYSDDTQFILITHRKGSMEVCDMLYGVAMEEKGVSRVVSARFSETA